MKPNAGDETVSWNVRLSDDEPWKSYVVVGFAFLAGLTGIAIFGHFLFGMLGFAIILAATAEFWLGMRFVVDSRGVSRRCGLSLSAIEWAEVKRVTVQEHNVSVSPLRSASRLDVFRGVTLRVTPQNAELVVAAIRANWSGDVRFLERRSD